MASKDIYLYDELSLQWEKVATNGDIETVTTNLEEHELKLLHTEQGVHGVRFWNNKLEYSDDNGVTWIEIQTGGGGASLPISANDVVDSSTRVLISPVEKGQISTNASDITSHSQRINVLETTVNNLATTDEKVKMNSSDTAGFLGDKIDNLTIKSVNNKLVASSLSGLTSTVQELNQLQGVSGNVQQQLDNLTSLVAPSEIVNTEQDLPNPVLPSGTVVLVRNDADHGGNTTFYISNGTQWDFVDTLDAGIARDFLTNPINLTTETTGLLQKSKYEKQNALETPILDASNLFTATNVEDALSELFTYANNIKSIANVIGSPLSSSDTSAQLNSKMQTLKTTFASNLTNKGVLTYYYSTLEEMINRVLSIPNVTLEGATKRTSKLNITAPYTQNVILNDALAIEDVAATVLKFVGSNSGIVHYNADYNNNEASSFDYNIDEVAFDGAMKIKDKYSYTLTEVNTDYFESEDIDFTKFIEFGSDSTISLVTDEAIIEALMVNSSVVVANGDISLAGIDSIDSITWGTVITGTSDLKMAMSFDSGVTWLTWDGLSWNTLDIDDKLAFKNNGMNTATINNITDLELKVARGDSETLRFAYYLYRENYNSKAENDKIQVSVTTTGYNVIADTNEYSYTYDQATKTLSFNFNTDGTYTITYVDSL